MPIRVKCSKCGNKFGAPSKYAGKKVKCPKCSEPLVIPKANGNAKKSASSADKTKAKTSSSKSAAAKPKSNKIAVKCKCGEKFAAKPELMGKTVRCPGCQNPVKIGGKRKDAPAKKKAAPAASDQVSENVFDELGIGSADGPERRCPECRAVMSEEAILCIECGYNENLGRKMTVKRPVTQEDRDKAHEEKTLTGGGEAKKEKAGKKNGSFFKNAMRVFKIVDWFSG